jgi:hypothetical protein
MPYTDLDEVMGSYNVRFDGLVGIVLAHRNILERGKMEDVINASKKRFNPFFIAYVSNKIRDFVRSEILLKVIECAFVVVQN